jgi:hypothetical protein
MMAVLQHIQLRITVQEVEVEVHLPVVMELAQLLVMVVLEQHLQFLDLA